MAPTVTVISLKAVAPWLSVAVKRKTYEPAVDIPVMVVLKEVELVMAKVTGPEIFVHEVLAIVPGAVSLAVPVTVTELVGKVMAWFPPAFAVGAMLAQVVPFQSDPAVHVVVTVAVESNIPLL